MTTDAIPVALAGVRPRAETMPTTGAPPAVMAGVRLRAETMTTTTGAMPVAMADVRPRAATMTMTMRTGAVAGPATTRGIPRPLVEAGRAGAPKIAMMTMIAGPDRAAVTRTTT